MSTIVGKINLASLTHVIQEKKNKAGEMIKCVVIPIEQNHLFQSEKGNLFMDLIAFDLKELKDDQSHLVKQSLPKAVREKMSKEDQEKLPIIGSLNVNFGGGGGNQVNNAAGGAVLSEEDDLPF